MNDPCALVTKQKTGQKYNKKFKFQLYYWELYKLLLRKIHPLLLLLDILLVKYSKTSNSYNITAQLFIFSCCDWFFKHIVNFYRTERLSVNLRICYCKTFICLIFWVIFGQFEKKGFRWQAQIHSTCNKTRWKMLWQHDLISILRFLSLLQQKRNGFVASVDNLCGKIRKNQNFEIIFSG